MEKRLTGFMPHLSQRGTHERINIMGMEVPTEESDEPEYRHGCWVLPTAVIGIAIIIVVIVRCMMGG
jgi:hypothetical protein